MRGPDIAAYIGATLIFGGALFLGILYATIGIKRIRRRTSQANGVVLRHNMRGWNPRVPCPVIDFVDRNGVRHEFQSTCGASWDEWPVGSQVRISYDPDDPTNAELAFSELATLIIIMFAVVGGFLAFAVTIVMMTHGSP
jgi:hypothetical protein